MSGASVRPVPFLSPMPIGPAYIPIRLGFSLIDTCGVKWFIAAATDFIFGI